MVVRGAQAVEDICPKLFCELLKNMHFKKCA